MQLKVLALKISLFFSVCLEAQPPSYPQRYFRNPLALPMELVANFGELRPNHWHMGLDIRTNQKENQPVYAAAGGYIAFIGIRPQSFGRFIIINHPNGLSTLYAHLNDFYPLLEKFVTDQQYKKESWTVELDITPEKFPVTKGQFIAYSGNTGGSQGPHLHFEIFETKTGKRLNPLLFDFPVKDNVPPSLVKLAVYDRRYSVFEQTPKFYPLKNTDSGYIISKLPVLKTGLNKISFAIQTFDRLSGSQNPNGVYTAALYMDEQLLTAFILDSIDYDETQTMNAHIDYSYRYDGGPYLQHLSVLPGNKGSMYKASAGNGVVMLSDSMQHAVRIEVRDANNNISALQFFLQYDDSLATADPSPPQAQLFVPGRANTLERPDFQIYLPEGCLYDTVQSFYNRGISAAPYSVSALHQVKDASVPVHNELTVRIKPDKVIQEAWMDKLVIHRSYRGSSSIRKAQMKDGWLEASFGDFGNFQAFADVVPPLINDLGKGDTIDLSPQSRIVFTPTDNFAVKSFRAELDSQWIRFTNDKSRNWIYVFDERCPYGMHHLKVRAEDIAGNVTVKEWWFKKYPYTPPPKKKVVKKKASSKRKTTATKKPVTKKK